MDSFILNTFSIKDHPIRDLKDKFKTQYVMGLGEFMCYMSKKDSRASLVFKVWSNSIIRETPSSYWQYDEECNRIKKALSLKRDGIRFFTMRREFFFDCLYLASKINQEFVTLAYEFLYEHVRDIIAKRVLKNIYENWNYPTLLKVPTQLIAHKRMDEAFQKTSLKRVLVVATMNAGKSTLINALTGCRINEVKSTACTEKIHYVYNKPCVDGISIKRTDGRYMYRYDTEANDKGQFVECALHFQSELSDCKICFIDTPGVNYASDSNHGAITYQSITENNYDLLLFVSNSNYFGTTDEVELLKFLIKKTKKPIVCVLNKIDSFKEARDSIDKMIIDFNHLLTQLNCASKVIPLSAEAALYSKLDMKKLDKDEREEYKQYKRKFEKNYYDLPSYYGENSSGNFTERTGILLLEKIINNSIK